MKTVVYQVKIVVADKDGCGNAIPLPTEGEIRKVLMNGLLDCESITVDATQN